MTQEPDDQGSVRKVSSPRPLSDLHTTEYTRSDSVYHAAPIEINKQPNQPTAAVATCVSGREFIPLVPIAHRS